AGRDGRGNGLAGIVVSTQQVQPARRSTMRLGDGGQRPVVLCDCACKRIHDNRFHHTTPSLASHGKSWLSMLTSTQASLAPSTAGKMWETLTSSASPKLTLLPPARTRLELIALPPNVRTMPNDAPPFPPLLVMDCHP